MPIKKATAFTASDGSMHATVEEAQRREVNLLAAKVPNDGKDGLNNDDLVEFVFTYREQLLDILTTGPRSRPAARKAKGTTLPRRAAATASDTELKAAHKMGFATVAEYRAQKAAAKAATPEQAKAGLKAMRAAADEATAMLMAADDATHNKVVAGAD